MNRKQFLINEIADLVLSRLDEDNDSFSDTATGMKLLRPWLNAHSYTPLIDEVIEEVEEEYLHFLEQLKKEVLGASIQFFNSVMHFGPTLFVKEILNLSYSGGSGKYGPSRAGRRFQIFEIIPLQDCQKFANSVYRYYYHTVRDILENFSYKVENLPLLRQQIKEVLDELVSRYVEFLKRFI